MVDISIWASTLTSNLFVNASFKGLFAYFQEPKCWHPLHVLRCYFEVMMSAFAHVVSCNISFSWFAPCLGRFHVYLGRNYFCTTHKNLTNFPYHLAQVISLFLQKEKFSYLVFARWVKCLQLANMRVFGCLYNGFGGRTHTLKGRKFLQGWNMVL